MKSEEVEKWGIDITKKICKYWEEISENNDFIKKNGFSVFYSPLKFKPKLMIIGFNPGGNFERNNIPFNPNDITKKLPKEHDYFLDENKDWKIVKPMKDIFNFNQNILKESVKLNFYFFRSSSINKLYNNCNNWKDIHNFCSEKIKDIINKLQPEIILTEGLTVFDMLLISFDIKHIIKTLKDKNTNKNRILQFASSEKFNLLGMIHPSGGWTKKKFENNKDKIIKELKNYLQVETTL